MTVSAEEKAFFIQLGARIAMLRKAVDVTQVELAEELNGSQHTKQSYEVGRRRIPVSGLPLVAQKLNISLDELFGDRLLRGPKRLCGDKR